VTPLIEYRGNARRFTTRRGTVTACENVNLTVKQGEFLAIVGPSGCGKSTLLNMAAGLLPPSAGTVLYRVEKVPEPNTRVGHMTQHDTLLPWRSVEDNVGSALELRGQDRATRIRAAHDWLHRVGLKGFETAYPAQLSGGMRRRVSTARTLAYEPETILMDEPFGALDAQLRLVMYDELLKLWAATKTTMCRPALERSGSRFWRGGWGSPSSGWRCGKPPAAGSSNRSGFRPRPRSGRS
jgi:NitT/TauT family transport system ATP-binding protein